VVVEGAVRVGYVETVMPSVESGVEPLVHVHGAVEEVLPSVDDQDSDHKLQCWDTEVINHLGRSDLPISEGGRNCLFASEHHSLRELRVYATSQRARQHRMLSADVLSNANCIDSNKSKHAGDRPLRNP
jgi:hypothetical protein